MLLTRARPKNLENRRATDIVITQKTAPRNAQKTRFATTLLTRPRKNPMLNQSV